MTERSLTQLLAGLSGYRLLPSQIEPIIVSSIVVDSRQVKPGSLFIAVSGGKFDGRSFIAAAVASGAVAIVAEEGEYEFSKLNLPLIFVAEIRQAISQIAANFYGNPSQSLTTIGVTGTNGKSSVAWITACALAQLDAKCVLLGTLGTGLVTKDCLQLENSANTTACPTEIHRVLAQGLDAGASSAALEATSQGIAQKRTKAVAWDAAIFTNLTRDHLDIHQTMENYARLKKELFTSELKDSPKKKKVAVVNIDDAVGVELAQELIPHANSFSSYTFSAKSISDSQKQVADCQVVSLELKLLETRICLNLFGEEIKFSSKLIGRYNVSNLLASATALAALGYSASSIACAFESVPSVPGRLERVGESEVCVVVDYAHTPDALDTAQQSLREICHGRMITVFGCGGDRDRGKRPLMAEAVAKLADYAIVTSDNPRSENPERIIDDIVPGFEQVAPREGFSWARISCRRSAITEAIKLAQPGDVVLVAGKGHEDYQEIESKRYPFLDRDVCLGAMSSLGLV